VLSGILQLGVPLWQGTLIVASAPVNALFPFTTSLNTHPAASLALDVQLDPLVFANAYKT
jgi:hypothetical protein